MWIRFSGVSLVTRTSRSALLQVDVGGAGEEVNADAGRYRGEGPHRTGHHHDAVDQKGAGRDRGSHVIGLVDDVAELLYFVSLHVQLYFDTALGAVRNHQMHLDVLDLTQELQQRDRQVGRA